MSHELFPLALPGSGRGTAVKRDPAPSAVACLFGKSILGSLPKMLDPVDPFATGSAPFVFATGEAGTGNTVTHETGPLQVGEAD